MSPVPPPVGMQQPRQPGVDRPLQPVLGPVEVRRRGDRVGTGPGRSRRTAGRRGRSRAGARGRGSRPRTTTTEGPSAPGLISDTGFPLPLCSFSIRTAAASEHGTDEANRTMARQGSARQWRSPEASLASTGCQAWGCHLPNLPSVEVVTTGSPVGWRERVERQPALVVVAVVAVLAVPHLLAGPEIMADDWMWIRNGEFLGWWDAGGSRQAGRPGAFVLYALTFGLIGPTRSCSRCCRSRSGRRSRQRPAVPSSVHRPRRRPRRDASCGSSSRRTPRSSCGRRRHRPGSRSSCWPRAYASCGSTPRTSLARLRAARRLRHVLRGRHARSCPSAWPSTIGCRTGRFRWQPLALGGALVRAGAGVVAVAEHDRTPTTSAAPRARSSPHLGCLARLRRSGAEPAGVRDRRRRGRHRLCLPAGGRRDGLTPTSAMIVAGLAIVSPARPSRCARTCCPRGSATGSPSPVASARPWSGWASTGGRDGPWIPASSPSPRPR